jgi:DNA replication licensing factor MCM5
MDSQSVYSTHVYEPSFGENGDTRLQIQQQLETFILDFRLDNNFVYRYVADLFAAWDTYMLT